MHPSPIDNIRLPGDFLDVKMEYYQNCSVLDCVAQLFMSSSYRSNRFGLSHWDPYAACV